LNRVFRWKLSFSRVRTIQSENAIIIRRYDFELSHHHNLKSNSTFLHIDFKFGDDVNLTINHHDSFYFPLHPTTPSCSTSFHPLLLQPSDCLPPSWSSLHPTTL